MTFPPLDSESSLPSENLQYFTNRITEREVLDRAISIPPGNPLPVLMFYGVGGSGKTWLLQRLKRESKGHGIPSAMLDLDTRRGATYGRGDIASRLAEIRVQLGRNIKCHQFDLAYAWLRAKQGDISDPAFRGGTALGLAWEFVQQLGPAVASDIPTAGLWLWAADKLSAPLRNKLQESGISDWLALANGEKFYVSLKYKDPSEIADKLSQYLLLDLRDELPSRNSTQCRAVIYLDTFESLSHARSADHAQDAAQSWVRQLYHPDSPLLLVIAGRDRLRWGDSAGTDFAEQQHLEQHLIGGLAELDARDYLSQCSVQDTILQDAILRVCIDPAQLPNSSPTTDHSPVVGYHPFTLGLCADLVWNNSRVGNDSNASTFGFSPHDIKQLANRFLKSMGSDSAYEQWLLKLALPPRFNEAAARAAFSSAQGADVDAAWSSLLRYSFVYRAEPKGWLCLHARMRSALISLLQQQRLEADDPWATGHAWWCNYWQEQSQDDIDDFAALSWFHNTTINPQDGRDTWRLLAHREREFLRMDRHLALTNWILPLITDQFLEGITDAGIANLLLTFATELRQASLGDRKANLNRAISYLNAAGRFWPKKTSPEAWAFIQANLGYSYLSMPECASNTYLHTGIKHLKSTLQVWTATQSPSQWASTQSALGNAYCEGPTANKVADLKRAVHYYKASLRVRTQKRHPLEWAETLCNLGSAYCEMRTTHHQINIQRGIKYFKSAMQILTKNSYPVKWAGIQNNIGNAYTELRTGDRTANLRHAIKHYKLASLAWTKQMFPEYWAKLQYNIGSAYWCIPTGNQSTNAHTAKKHYHAAMEVYTNKNYPGIHKTIENHLKEIDQELGSVSEG